MGIIGTASAAWCLLWGGLQEPGPEPEVGPPQTFLSAVAAERGWRLELGTGGRWLLYSNVDPRLMRSAVELIDHFFRRLDETFPASAEAEPVVAEPVILLFLNSKADQDAVCEAIGAQWSHLGDWAQGARAFPYFDLFATPLVLVRHDPSMASIQRPEVKLAHMAVPLELARRFGRLPFWVGEAIGYALQEEKLGAVYGYTMKKAEVFEEDFHVTWRQRAHAALVQPMAVTQLMADARQDFDRQRAYTLMGVARYWLSQNPQGLAAFVAAAAAERPQKANDHEYEPSPSLQAQWLEQACGAGWLQQAAAANPEVAAVDGQTALAADIREALEAAVKAGQLKPYSSKSKRFILWSDFEAKPAQSAVKACEELLRHLDGALGADAAAGTGTPMDLFLVREGAAYEGLCDALAAAHPGQSVYLRNAKQSTGFTLQDHWVSTYFHDVKVQEEGDPKHSIVHNLAHLELYRRYGSLPLWLAEGIACAGEDATLGAVYGNWYRDEFVYSISHGAWREASATIVTGNAYDLDDLFGYAAQDYHDDLAHFAFAFAVYGLEKEPKALAAFLAGLQEERNDTWTGAGRFEPPSARLDALARSTFGADFAKKFEKYWKAPPKRK